MRTTPFILLALCLLASGCANMSNRAYCSPDGRELVFVSWYSRVGIAAQVDGDDAQVLCRKAAGQAAK